MTTEVWKMIKHPICDNGTGYRGDATERQLGRNIFKRKGRFRNIYLLKVAAVKCPPSTFADDEDDFSPCSAETVQATLARDEIRLK